MSDYEIYTLSIKSDKTACIIGEPVTFTGKLMHCWNGNSEPMVGVEVELYCYFPSNPWNVMGIGTSDSKVGSRSGHPWHFRSRRGCCSCSGMEETVINMRARKTV